MKLYAMTLAASIPLVLLLPFCGGGIDRRPIEDLSSDEVTYQSEDGVRIVAGWFMPPNAALPPVAVLLHEQDGTRDQWNELIPVLVDEGYAVLAPDLRGFGKSDTIIRDGREEPYETTNRPEFLLDVDAALKFLKGRDDVDLNRIGVVGARLGADLAYMATALFPEVKAAVAMTPSPFSPEDSLFGAVPDYAARDIFFMAGALPAWEAAATLGIRVQNFGGDRYEDHSELDGVALLTIDQPVKDILKWFEERLNNPIPTVPIG